MGDHIVTLYDLSGAPAGVVFDSNAPVADARRFPSWDEALDWAFANGNGHAVKIEPVNQ